MSIALRNFSIFPKQHSAPHQSVYQRGLGMGILALRVRHFKYQGT